MYKKNPYIDKHNHWSSHCQIAKMLDGLPKGAPVLDVGVASGTLARICMNHGYTIRGIEPNIEWLGDARKYYSDLYEGFIEQAPDSFIRDHAAVVCGDILEHLVNPVEQLLRLVNAQPDGCLFIISVPNIANIYIRLNLLFGHFEYTERGIMDHTHLHFYTRKTFISLLNNAGLDIIEIHASPIPLDLVNPFFSKRFIGRAIFRLLAIITTWWPTMLGYQLIAKANKVYS